jgi:hypothetical protein
MPSKVCLQCKKKLKRDKYTAFRSPKCTKDATANAPKSSPVPKMPYDVQIWWVISLECFSSPKPLIVIYGLVPTKFRTSWREKGVLPKCAPPGTKMFAGNWEKKLFHEAQPTCRVGETTLTPCKDTGSNINANIQTLSFSLGPYVKGKQQKKKRHVASRRSLIYLSTVHSPALVPPDLTLVRLYYTSEASSK